MSFSKETILEALKRVSPPASARGAGDLVASGRVHNVAWCDGFASVTLDSSLAAYPELKAQIEHEIRAAADKRSANIARITIDFMPPEGKRPTTSHPAEQSMKQASSSRTTSSGAAAPSSPSMPGVRNIIAVGAGKGGVGKSTVSVNLAVGLARQGHAVGLLDGDIYGPSAPTLLGLDSLETSLVNNRLQVFYVHGIKAMTIGKLVDPEKPLIWRGPMAHGAFKQLCEQTDWGQLDYLIIDLPPGTGDVPLTMCQLMSLTGAVIVCTPQKVAQDDAIRAVRMFQQLNTDVLGIVENMSYFIGDDGKEYDIFGRGGAEQMAQRLGLPFLGSIPINMTLREHSDAGTPVKNFTSAGDAMKKSLESMVKRVEDEAALAILAKHGRTPQLTVS